MRRGELTYPSYLRKEKTIAGTAENPIAYDTYENIYKCLDAEFYSILDIYMWHKSGLYKVNIDNIPYKWSLSVKYLIEYNEILEKNRKIF